ncbi:MAG: hypothetical protein HYR84_06760 [Planctomycetes bacterium]|nr:hypothetical protein [Planctomycetota bacterium]
MSCFNTLNMTLNAWLRALEARKPARFPHIVIRAPLRRFQLIPLELERHVFGLEATENLLNTPEYDQLFWEPMRRGLPVPKVPLKALGLLCQSREYLETAV